MDGVLEPQRGLFSGKITENLSAKYKKACTKTSTGPTCILLANRFKSEDLIAICWQLTVYIISRAYNV